VKQLEPGTIAVALNSVRPEQAAELERLGYAALWLPGGQLDTLDRITEVVEATERITVATAVIPPDVHPAGAVTQLYSRLQQEAPDRFVVGLGASQRQPKALSALDTYLDELDAKIPAERRILAALGPRKLEVARTRCAGAITLLVNPAYTATARRALGPDRVLVVDEFVVLDTNAERAREAARVRLRFLSQVGGYRANFFRMGFTELDVDTLSDRLVDDLVNWGDVEAIAARVGEHQQAGADQVVLTILGDDPKAAAHLAERLLP
jgi:probable F420-dependent oxidoreductase